MKRILILMLFMIATPYVWAAADCKNAEIGRVENNPANTFAFKNYVAEKSLGQCWALSHLHRLLLAGAHFSGGPTTLHEREDVIEKIKLLEKGIPVRFSTVASVRELTEKYETEIKNYVESKQLNIERNVTSYLGTGLAWLSSPGTSGQVSKIIKMLDKGERPLVGIKQGKSAHAVLVESYTQEANGSVLFQVVDSNRPEEIQQLYCYANEKCSYANLGMYQATISVIPPFKPNETKLARERCKMLNAIPKVKEKGTRGLWHRAEP